MSAIDSFRQLVEGWDEQERQLTLLWAENARLDSELEATKRELAEFRAQARREWIIFEDPLTGLPKEGPDAYAIDAPPGAFTIGPQGLRVTLNPGQLNKQGKAKAELGPRLGEKAERYGRIPFGVERWHALTVMLPESWERDGNKTPILSFHGSEDEGEKGIGRNASLSVFVVGDDWVGWRLWNDERIQSGNENRIETFRFPYKRGEPVRFIFRTVFDWRPFGQGATDIWVRRGGRGNVTLRYFSERGPNAYNDEVGPYMKCGLYFPVANAPNPWPEGSSAKSVVFSDLLIAGPGPRFEDLL